MTERLYLADPYLTRFDARVVAVRELEGKPAVILDRSAFFPEGGGQPGDRGKLGDASVIDTQIAEDEVLHLVDRPLEIGSTVQGQIDWARRLDHMQQHHGQHLLSAAFLAVHQAPTTSFHMGSERCTIDLAIPIFKLDDAALRSAEAAANASIWRNLPVVARDFVGEERAKLSLRKEAVKGDRVVFVEGVDASPCGGTHPARTAEVGAVAVLGAEKWGANASRVEFVCGGRVVRALAQMNAALSSTAAGLRCNPFEVPQVVAKLADDAQARKKSIELLEKELAQLAAARLASEQPLGPVVAKVERGAGMARGVAQALQGLGRVALIASVDEGRAYLCFARPKGPGPAMGELLKSALALLGGKGGGAPEMAQGSGDPARLDEALAQARAALG